MVKRVKQNWLAEGTHPAFDHVFEHIGVTWPIDEREKLFDIAFRTAFPPNVSADAWRGYDQTSYTVGGKFYYPITAILSASPSIWFRNLRLLQIRRKLDLITSLRITVAQPSILAGEALAKLQALEAVVGKEMTSTSSVVPLQNLRMMSTRTARIRATNARAESIRNAGLRALNAREQQN